MKGIMYISVYSKNLFQKVSSKLYFAIPEISFQKVLFQKL